MIYSCQSPWMSPSQIPQMMMTMGDPNKTKQYYQGQEDETAKDSRLKPDSSTTIVVTDPPAVPGNPRKPDDSNPSILVKENQPTKPIPSKAPAVGIPAKPLPPSPAPPLTLWLWPKESRNVCSQPSSGQLPQSRPRAPEKIWFDVWRITPVYIWGCRI